MRLFPDGLAHEVLRSQWLRWTEALQADFPGQAVSQGAGSPGAFKMAGKAIYRDTLCISCVSVCVSENLHNFE